VVKGAKGREQVINYWWQIMAETVFLANGRIVLKKESG